ncbi:MAG: hypothetical protein ABL982_03980 [Vicinamibacterales bacterium]
MTIKSTSFQQVGIMLAFAALSLPSCSTLLRENVLATTETSVGVSLGQNHQTGSYELDVGYGRREFFFVPTSKRVHNKGEPGPVTENNDPSQTPEVLAVIGATGQAGDANAKGTIGQALAVGRLAVQSPVAIAVFARDSKTAEAASTASANKPIVARSQPVLQSQIAYYGDSIRGLSTLALEGDVEAKRHMANLDVLARATTFASIPLKYTFDKGADPKLEVNALKVAPYKNELTAYATALDVVNAMKVANEYAKAIGSGIELLGEEIIALEAEQGRARADGKEITSAQIDKLNVLKVRLGTRTNERAAMQQVCEHLAAALTGSESFTDAMAYYAGTAGVVVERSN